MVDTDRGKGNEMSTIYIDDKAAIELRDWLNERHTLYARHPITDAQLAVWLDEAEQGQGQVEIRARDSVSGTPEIYRA